MVFAPSCPHPWDDTKVDSVAEEYAHARAFAAQQGLRLEFTGQELVVRDGRYFDKLHARDQHGRPWWFCYDINSFYPPAWAKAITQARNRDDALTLARLQAAGDAIERSAPLGAIDSADVIAQPLSWVAVGAVVGAVRADEGEGLRGSLKGAGVGALSFFAFLGVLQYTLPYWAR